MLIKEMHDYQLVLLCNKMEDSWACIQMMGIKRTICHEVELTYIYLVEHIVSALTIAKQGKFGKILKLCMKKKAVVFQQPFSLF